MARKKNRVLYDVQRDLGSEFFVVLRNGKEVARHDTKGAAWDDMERRIRTGR